MPRLQQSLIAAASGIGAIILSGCASFAGDGERRSMMGEGHDCMKMMHAKHQGEAAPAEGGKTGMTCKMMDKHGAGESAAAPSPASPEDHQHTPDAPAAGH